MVRKSMFLSTGGLVLSILKNCKIIKTTKRTFNKFFIVIVFVKLQNFIKLKKETALLRQSCEKNKTSYSLRLSPIRPNCSIIYCKQFFCRVINHHPRCWILILVAGSVTKGGIIALLVSAKTRIPG
jgi:hypothetical protein